MWVMQEEPKNTSHTNALADAAETIAHQLGHARLFAEYYTTRAWNDRPPGESVDYSYLEQAQKMMRLTAELAGSLARLRGGEMRQHIVVERIERAAPASATPGGGGEGPIPENESLR